MSYLSFDEKKAIANWYKKLWKSGIRFIVKIYIWWSTCLHFKQKMRSYLFMNLPKYKGFCNLGRDDGSRGASTKGSIGGVIKILKNLSKIQKISCCLLLCSNKNCHFGKIEKLPKWHYWTRAWNSKIILAERLFLKCYEDDIYKKYS